MAPLSFLYGMGVRLKFALSVGKSSLPGFVVSIGNLTVGGTGKTPAACLVAQWALDQGNRVAVLSRGYSGNYDAEVFEVSDGENLKAGPNEAGDEPYLMAKRLQGVPVIVSRKRYLAGLYAQERHDTNFHVLDDGFQHIGLKRDLDLLLINAVSPFGNGHLLPWGPLRERIGQLERADVFIITRAKQGTGSRELRGFLEERFPGKLVFESDHAAREIVFPIKNEAQGAAILEGKRVVAFAGIARPEAFRDTLIELGADVLDFEGFRDHHFFSQSEIQELVDRTRRLNADYLLTTEKDWVRIEGMGIEFEGLGYVTVEFEIQDEEAFYGMIKEKMKE